VAYNEEKLREGDEMTSTRIVSKKLEAEKSLENSEVFHTHLTSSSRNTTFEQHPRNTPPIANEAFKFIFLLFI
jgi:hypothetical protein